eukprot:scaffold42_cov432-Pavlova_lutheri.AAC.6
MRLQRTAYADIYCGTIQPSPRSPYDTGLRETWRIRRNATSELMRHQPYWRNSSPWRNKMDAY